MSVQLHIACASIYALLSLSSSASHAASTPNDKRETDTVQEARVYHIQFQSQSAAEKAYAKLSATSHTNQFLAFKALARKESMDRDSAKAGGDLGTVREGEMVKGFEDAAFHQNLQTISEPFKSLFGWHLIYVTSKIDRPVADICRETLATFPQHSPKPSNAVIDFTTNAIAPQGLHPAALQFIGDGWGPPLKDWNGDLGYLRRIDIQSTTNIVNVELHTEFVRAIYNAQPLACRRSARGMFQVDCQNGTVTIRSHEEYEGRAASGRKLVDMHWGDSLPMPSKEGFYAQLAKFACRAK